LLVLSGLAATAAPSRAQATDYPWCIVYSGDHADGGEHCMFVSYAQCLMTATPGSGAVCVRNLRLARP
jgi:hypothetical protein